MLRRRLVPTHVATVFVFATGETGVSNISNKHKRARLSTTKLSFTLPVHQQGVDLHKIRLDPVFESLQAPVPKRSILFEGPALIADVVLPTRPSTCTSPRLVWIRRTAVHAEDLSALSAVPLRGDERELPLALHAALRQLVRQKEAQLVTILTGTQLLL